MYSFIGGFLVGFATGAFVVLAVLVIAIIIGIGKEESLIEEGRP